VEVFWGLKRGFLKEIFLAGRKGFVFIKTHITIYVKVDKLCLFIFSKESLKEPFNCQTRSVFSYWFFEFF